MEESEETMPSTFTPPVKKQVAKKLGTPIGKPVTPASSKRKSAAFGNEQPMFEDSRLPPGWSRNLIQRQGGATAGKYDVYIISPQQKKFRSRNELRSFFDRSSTSLSADDFDFSVCGKDLNISTEQINNSKDTASAGKVKSKYVPKKRQFSKSPVIAGIQSDKKSPEAGRTAKKRKRTRSPSSDLDIRDTSLEDYASMEYKDTTSSPYFHWAAMKKDRIRISGPHLGFKKWTPPRSPYNLIQENLYHDPWKLLVATILLNRTSALVDDLTGRAATPIIYNFFEQYPDPSKVSAKDVKEMASLIKPLGLHEKRARIIAKFSEEYQHSKWTYPNELHGIGKYGNDSYRIFCVDEWRDVSPCDAMLIAYRNWLINNWRDFCNKPELAQRRTKPILSG